MEIEAVSASYLGYFEELKSLFDKKIAGVDTVDEYGDSVLHAAAARGRLQIMHYLIKKGADVNLKNKVGSTPLHKAALAKNDSLEIVRLLLKHGANPNVKNDSGILPEELTRDIRMQELLQGDSAVTIKVPVPKDLHGRIIGKGGKNLKDLREETRCSITIPSATDRVTDILVKGRPEQVEVCKKRILALTQSKSAFEEKNESQESRDDFTTTRIKIPKHKHKVIVGKGGKGIKEICDGTSAQILIPLNNEPEEEIRVKGPLEDVDLVVKRMMEKIRNFDTLEKARNLESMEKEKDVVRLPLSNSWFNESKNSGKQVVGRGDGRRKDSFSSDEGGNNGGRGRGRNNQRNNPRPQKEGEVKEEKGPRAEKKERPSQTAKKNPTTTGDK